MAKSIRQLKGDMDTRFGGKADRSKYLSAIIGHPDGTVYVVDRAGYVWARVGGANGQIIQVYARGMLAAYNLPILIYRLPHRPRDYGIADLDINGWASTGSGESNTGGYTGGGYVQAHAEQHYFTGGDPVLTHLRAWTPLRVYVSTGFTIGVQAGIIPRTGSDLEVPSQTLDLTSHIPASGALYVLITVDAAGALAATDGTAASGIIALTLADIPDTPAGHFRLAAVRLYVGQTSLQENRSVTDIVDLRWPQERLAGDVLEQFGTQTANTYLAGPTSGANALPTFRAGVTDDIASGVFPIARGGTNAATANSALNNLLPAQSGQAGNVLGTDGSNASWGPGGGGSGTIILTSLPVGTIVPYGASAMPSGWLECNGAAVSRTTYAELFAAIGTTYGAGDDSTTFNLPDMRGRVSVGRGTGSGLTPRTLGATGGEESHVLTTPEMPAHTHGLPNNSTGAFPGSGDLAYGLVDVNPGADNVTTSTGSGTAHNTMPPFVVMAWIIKYTTTATSDLIFDDSALPENVATTAATGDDVYAARRDHVHAGLTGSGTANVIAKWGATSALTDSVIYENTAKIGIGDTTPNQLLGLYGTAAQISIEESDTEFLRLGVGETDNTSIIGWDDSDSLILGVYSSPTDTTIDPKVTITSAGAVTATGVLTIPNNPVIGGYTLTVPETGTALLRDANIAAGRVAFGSDANIVTGEDALFWDAANNRLGIGTTIPGYAIDAIAAGSGAIRLSENATNATNKFGRFVVRHYTNAEEDVIGFNITSANGTANIVQFGGGSGIFNAATLIQFYTASNANTLTGTERMSIDNAGYGRFLGDYTANRVAIGADFTKALPTTIATPLHIYSATAGAWQAATIQNGNSATNDTADLDWRMTSASVTTGRMRATRAGSGGMTNFTWSLSNGSTLTDRLWLLGTNGYIGIGASPMTLLHTTLNNAATNTIDSIFTLAHNSSGTAAAGFGGAIALTLESSSSADQNAAAINWSWNTATHASAVADLVFLAGYNNGAAIVPIEFLRGRGGANPLIGFLGATPASQQTGGAATATGTWTATEQGMLQKAYDALRTFGLLS